MGKEILPEQSIRILAEVKPKAEFYCCYCNGVTSIVFFSSGGESCKWKTVICICQPNGNSNYDKGWLRLRNSSELLCVIAQGSPVQEES